MGATAYSFIGSVFLGLLDADKQLVGGYRKVGNVYPLSLQVSTEQKKQISRMRENAGTILHAKTTITDVAGSMNLREYDAYTLAWALSGGATEMTGGGGSVLVGAPESIVAVHNEYVALAHKTVSAVVVKDETDTTTYVLDTHYRLNAALGLIEVIDGGGIADGATLHVSYTYAAETGYKVDIGSNALIRVKMLIDGENEVDGTPVTAEFDSVVIAANGEINLISDPGTDYEEIPFSLTFETLAGQTSPGRINGVPI